MVFKELTRVMQISHLKRRNKMAKQDKPTAKDQKSTGNKTLAFSYKGEPSDMRKQASQLEEGSRLKKMIAGGLTKRASSPEAKARKVDTLVYEVYKHRGKIEVNQDMNSRYTSETSKKRAADWLNKAKQDSTNASNLKKQADAIDKKRANNAMNIINKSAGLKNNSVKVPYKKK